MAISLLYGLDAPLFDEDEGFYAEASREMLLRKDFVSITVNGQHRYDKPPLVFWMVAASQYVFGQEEWAVRLPSMIMSFALLILLYRFCRKHLGEASTLNVLLLFSGSIQISMISKAAIADATLHFFMVCTFFNCWTFIAGGQKKFLLYAGASAAFAFLAKGPVALVIPVGVMLVYCLRWRTWKLIRTMFHLPSIALFLIIVVPWFYLSYQKVGFLVIEDFFLKHNVGRFTKAMESHGGSWFYYVPVFFLGLLPFGFLHAKSLLGFRTLWQDKFSFFLLTWFCLVFLIFSASGTKLPHYILIAYVPLILISARRDPEAEWRGVAGSGLFLVLVFLAAPVLAPSLSPKIPDVYVQALISGVGEFDLFYFLWMVAALLIILVSIFYKSLQNRVLVMALTVVFSFNVFFMYYGKLQQSPVKAMALASAGISEEIVMPTHYFPSFSYYSNRVCEIRRPVAGELAFGKLVDFKDDNIEVLRQQYGVGLVRIRKPDQ